MTTRNRGRGAARAPRPGVRSSVPRATCSSSSAAVISRPAPTCPRSCSSSPRWSRAAPRVRARGLRRRRGVHVLRAPREVRIIGKEHLLEPLNRDALAIAARRGRESGALAAGDLSNTNAFYARRRVAAGRARDVRGAGRLDRRRRHGLRRSARRSRGPRRRCSRSRRSRRGACRGRDALDPSQRPMSARAGRPRRPARGSPRPAPTSSGSTAFAGPARCCRWSSGSATPSTCHVAALPVPYRTTEERAELPVAAPTRIAIASRRRPFPTALDPFTLQPLRDRRVRAARRTRSGSNYLGVCCGAAPHHVPQPRRGTRAHDSGEPLQPRHEPSRVHGH